MGLDAKATRPGIKETDLAMAVRTTVAQSRLGWKVMPVSVGTRCAGSATNWPRPRRGSAARSRRAASSCRLQDASSPSATNSAKASRSARNSVTGHV